MSVFVGKVSKEAIKLELPGGPVVKILSLQMQGVWV